MLTAFVFVGLTWSGPPAVDGAAAAAIDPWVAPLERAWSHVTTETVTRRHSPTGRVRYDVRASVGGIPLASPLARGFVDREGGVRWVPLLDHFTSAPPPEWFTVRIGQHEAQASVAAAGLQASTRLPRLVARPHAGTVALAWEVTLAPDPLSLSRRIAYIDAQTGALRLGPEFTREARARAFARNPVLDAKAQVFELTRVGDDAVALEGPAYSVLNCVEPASGSACELASVRPDLAGDFLFDPPDVSIATDNAQPEDPFAATSVAVHAEQFAGFAEALGLPPFPCDPQGSTPTFVANYKGYTDDGPLWVANAAYTGDCSLTAVFGQGAGADFGYDGDVVHHELAHGLVALMLGEGRTLGRPRSRPDAVVVDAPAIDEGVADFIAAVIAGDPDHAEYTVAYGGADPRSADNAARCPRSTTGESHRDAPVVSGALWDAYQAIGDPWIAVVLDALALLREDATFEEYAAHLIAIAEASLGQAAAAAAREALAGHGMIECLRVVDALALDAPLRVTPSGPAGRFEPMRPPPLQLSFTLPPARGRLVVEFDVEVFPDPGWSPLAELHVLVQHDVPLVFAYELDEQTTVVDARPDQQIAHVNAGRFEIAAEPAQTVYVVFFNLGLHIAEVGSFRTQFEPADEAGSEGTESTSSTAASSGPGPDAADTAQGGGCSCAAPVGHPGSRPWAAVLLVLGLGVGLRRPSSRVF